MDDPNDQYCYVALIEKFSWEQTRHVGTSMLWRIRNVLIIEWYIMSWFDCFAKDDMKMKLKNSFWQWCYVLNYSLFFEFPLLEKSFWTLWQCKGHTFILSCDWCVLSYNFAYGLLCDKNASLYMLYIGENNQHVLNEMYLFRLYSKLRWS